MLLFLSTRLSHTCSHPPLPCEACCRERLSVCLCGLVFLSASVCLWLRRPSPLPGNVLRQGSGLEKVSAALSICDAVPNWARSRFRSAWSNAARARRRRECVPPEKQVWEAANKTTRVPNTVPGCHKAKKNNNQEIMMGQPMQFVLTWLANNEQEIGN